MQIGQETLKAVVQVAPVFGARVAKEEFGVVMFEIVPPVSEMLVVVVGWVAWTYLVASRHGIQLW